MSLGKLLKKSRVDNDLTLQRVADYIGISSSYLSDLESGKASRPKIVILQKAAEYLQINSDELILAAQKIPPDVYWKIVHNPEILNVVRSYGE